MPLRVAVPDLISPSYFPAIAAVELGFFKKEGLDATVELLFPVPQAMEDLREGRLDFVAGSAHATLYAFKNWKGGKLLGTLAKHMYWFLILRSDLAAKKGDLNAVKGLRIGAAPGPVDGLRQMLTDGGIDLERDEVRIGPIPGSGGAGVSFGISAAKALEAGDIDGFWANGMGADVAIRDGVGTMVLDIRRGLGPASAQGYTFAAFVASQKKIDEEPEVVASALRALVGAQNALKEDPERAAAVGKALFPDREAGLIAELIRRDAPYYDPSISEETVAGMNRFAQDIDLLSGPVPYEDVVATQFSDIWRS